MRIIAVLIVGLITQAAARPLEEMVASERAFAATTAEVGVRAGFLTFFADNAVAIRPGGSADTTTLISAKDDLRARPPDLLPLSAVLTWEPLTGGVAADGSVGWLTGPYLRQSRAGRGLLGQGAYFSVWKRQADGTWRVFLDEGVPLPAAWRDTNGFREAPEPDAGLTGTPGESVAAAEAEISHGDLAWSARLASGVRLHRAGLMPVTGRDAVIAWRRTAWTSADFTSIRADTATSNDLAFAIGGYTATPASARAGAAASNEHGTWVRVWRRDAARHWRIVFETSKPAP